VNGRLLADSCSSSRACTAVGDYINRAGTVVALAERWNGTAWAIQADPAPPGSSASELDGVSCTGPDSCVAAGYQTDRAGVIVPLAESWNGMSWTVQAAAAPPGAVSSALFAIACPAASACRAVGEEVLFTGQVFTLAERWDGRNWAIQPSPNPGRAVDSALFAVSCPTASTCTAGGAFEGSNGITATLAERQDGTRWAIQRTPGPAGAVTGELEGMSCTSAAACTGTGFSTSAAGTTTTLAEGWDGTRWAIEPTPSPGGTAGSALNAISCLSAVKCTAAGGFATATGALTLAETWNGTNWARQATPNPAQAVVSDFTSVSCPARSSCVAAGFQEGRVGTAFPLAEGRAGRAWAVQAAANPAGARPSELIAVSCPSREDCMAVGLYARTAVITPLAEQWNGSRWQVQPAAAPIDSPAASLHGVSCASPTACIAVGFSYLRGESPSVPLAEAWNGSAWSIQRVPLPNGAQQASLYAVACSSADACTAVGNYDNHAGIPAGLVERWNGTRWTIQGNARPAKFSFLLGVACPGARTCVAAGYDSTGAGGSRPFAESWNGTSWQVQPLPLPAGVPGGTLSAISCRSPVACTAVGTHSGTSSGPMAERWDGTRWRYQAVPDPPHHTASTSNVGLFAVSCSSATFCAAAGNYNPSDRQTGFAETWHGSAWRLQAVTLPPGTTGSTLYGMACTGAGCTAVGSHYGAADISVTLAIARSSGS
jgi:hypothetical protein